MGMSNFWHNLSRPIFCLAPMEEVTDVAFREMCAKYGKPDVMFTEFLNVDGLLHPEGFKKLKIDLDFTEAQRPMVAQIWGTDPEKFYKAAQLMASLGFDGVDINMGCPQDKEIGIGACAALIREPKLAQEIILATKEGWVKSKTPTPPSRFAEHLPLTGEEAPQLTQDIVRSSPPFQGGVPASAGEVVGVPVSVKTRLGYSKTDEMEGWISNLLETNILSAITIHARTKQEKSKVPAHWEKITEAVKVRDRLNSKTLIIGNGDIKSREEGLARIQETGCDGVMVGKGAFGSPWFFAKDNHQTLVKDRLAVMLEHAELFDKLLGQIKPFVIMRKHFKAYASGFDGAHELRAKLMETKNLPEVREIVNNFFG